MLDVAKNDNNIVIYKKGKKKMKGTSRKNKGECGNACGTIAENKREPVSASGESERKSEHVWKLISKIAGGIAAVVAFAITVGTIISSVTATLTRHEKDIETLQGDVTGIKTKIETINESIDELTSLVKDDHEIFLQLASIDTREKAYNVVFKDAFQIKAETVQSEKYLAAPSWNEGEKALASDSDSDIIYSAEDLYNIPIITSYMEDGNEVYFYGRFNENNHWNGKCILNVYKANKLIYIFEGIYDDGALFSYKRLDNKGDTWLVNDRIYQETYNSGETWKYAKKDDFVKEFSMEDVKEKQILTVNKFLESKEQELLSYYHGNTSNGKYNDNTGNAYLVSYFQSGELPGAEGEEVIRTLYQGCFKDGTYDDSKGNSWYITREAKTTYMYYEGSFKKGKPDHAIEKNFENPIDRDYIIDKLKEKGFERYSPQFWVEY